MAPFLQQNYQVDDILGVPRNNYNYNTNPRYDTSENSISNIILSNKYDNNEEEDKPEYNEGLINTNNLKSLTNKEKWPVSGVLGPEGSPHLSTIFAKDEPSLESLDYNDVFNLLEDEKNEEEKNSIKHIIAENPLTDRLNQMLQDEGYITDPLNDKNTLQEA